MDAGQVIETLLKSGMVAKRAYETARHADDALDWAKFTKSPEFDRVQRAVRDQLHGLTEHDVNEAVKRIRAKQATFLRGRPIGELPIDELLQFGQLAEAEGILVRKQMKQLGSSPQFIHWAMDEALPVLAKVAKAVLPILL